MRIISGKYRGKHLHLPGNFRARPTTDFAKTGLFNIISNYFDLEGLDVLDLFSGTGSIGFEFASRGANYIEMVEKNFIHYNFIKQTISELKIENAKVYKTDVFIYIPRISRQFDIIFADPPYDMQGIERIPELIFKYKLLKEKAWLIIEHSASTDLSGHPGFHEQRKYGSVHFSIFVNKSKVGS